MDFWPKQGKAVVIAPTFQEDMAYSMTKRFGNAFKESDLNPIQSALTIPSDMVVKAPDVHFSFRYNAVLKEPRSNAASTPFFCVVAQSSEEFLYETKKVRPVHLYYFWFCLKAWNSWRGSWSLTPSAGCKDFLLPLSPRSTRSPPLTSCTSPTLYAC